MISTLLANRRGLQQAVCITGRPEGAPWIILSNSLGASMMMWEPQLELLSGRYRVLRYDTLGHGRSAAPAGPVSLEDLGDDVLAIMDHFGIASARYMGLSLGGMTGLGLALRHPERIERLVCCNARADAPDVFAAMWKSRLPQIDQGGLSALVAGTMERWFSETWRGVNRKTLARFEAEFLATASEGYKSCVAALIGLDYLKILGTLTVPALYVAGEIDSAAPPDVMRDMADRSPNASFTVIAGAAHISNVDKPEAFNAAIRKFLEI